MWRVQQTGPDWQDVMTTADRIGDFHNVDLTTSLRWDAASTPAKSLIVTRATERGEAGLRGLAFVEVASEWPSASHKTLEGLVYRQMIDLDHECSQELWKQSDFKPE